MANPNHTELQRNSPLLNPLSQPRRRKMRLTGKLSARPRSTPRRARRGASLSFRARAIVVWMA